MILMIWIYFFCVATGNSYSLLEKIYGMKRGVGQQVNRKLMRDIRIYMAVGGMPQAVESTHYYEIDFLISQGANVSAIEVKSSGNGKHESLTEFGKKYSKHIKESFILSQKDIDKEGTIKYIPIYLTSFLCK